jgi:hypothetical protein
MTNWVADALQNRLNVGGAGNIRPVLGSDFPELESLLELKRAPIDRAMS